VEFVQFDEAWRVLRPIGVEEASRTASELRLSLAESPNSSCFDIAAADHPMVARLPSDMPRFARGTLPTIVEAIVHKLHLTAAYVIPVGHWRQLFDGVAQGMASIEQWRATDSEATVELNTRDALQFQPGEFHILRELVRCVLAAEHSAVHGIAVATAGSPILIEVMPAGEVTIYTGRADLAALVRDLVAHASASPPVAAPAVPAASERAKSK
jgi:hypothetical protein